MELLQGLSFAGVNAHHQNGVAERRIRLVQDMSRTSLNHAINKWPKAINYHLWPYPVRNSAEVLNNTPSPKWHFEDTPQNKFANIITKARNYEWHHFGCPAYVLKEQLQGKEQIFDKWKQRARMGIYLGRSPQHASSVSLILNMDTGLTSPQFHVKLDSTFTSIKDETSEAQWPYI